MFNADTEYFFENYSEPSMQWIADAAIALFDQDEELALSWIRYWVCVAKEGDCQLESENCVEAGKPELARAWDVEADNWYRAGRRFDRAMIKLFRAKGETIPA